RIDLQAQRQRSFPGHDVRGDGLVVGLGDLADLEMLQAVDGDVTLQEPTHVVGREFHGRHHPEPVHAVPHHARPRTETLAHHARPHAGRHLTHHAGPRPGALPHAPAHTGTRAEAVTHTGSPLAHHARAGAEALPHAGSHHPGTGAIALAHSRPHHARTTSLAHTGAHLAHHAGSHHAVAHAMGHHAGHLLRRPVIRALRHLPGFLAERGRGRAEHRRERER